MDSLPVNPKPQLSPLSANLLSIGEPNPSRIPEDKNTNRTTICDLPLELWTEIYLILPDTDAVSLSATCKQARSIYDSDLRIGMQSFDLPRALALLNLRRPGSMPTWKRKILHKHMRKVRRGWKDKDTGKATSLKKFDFFGVGEERKDGPEGTTVKIGWQLEGLPEYNGGKQYSRQGVAVKRELEMHRSFFKSILERPMITPKVVLQADAETGRISILPSNSPQHWTHACQFPEAQPITLSPAEKERMTNLLLRMVQLELETPCFACYGPKKSDGIQKVEKVIEILDYAPLFKLERRELWEVAVLVKLLFLETARMERAAHRYYSHPIFNASNLRLALCTVLNEKARAFNYMAMFLEDDSSFLMKYDLLCTNEEHYHYKLTNLDNPEQEWLRGILWDENQQIVSEFMQGLHSTAANLLLENGLPNLNATPEDLESVASPEDETLFRVLQPLPRDANADEVKRHVEALNVQFMESTPLAKEPYDLWDAEQHSGEKFVALRVSRDGVLSFDEEGNPVDDSDEGGRWAIFRNVQMEKLLATRDGFLSQAAEK